VRIGVGMPRGNWVVTPNKFLDAQQVAILRRTMDVERRSGDKYSVRNASIIETLLGTGLRVSELCSLVVADLFLGRGSANVLVRKGKGGKTRLVAISASLTTYLVGFLKWKTSAGQSVTPTSPVFLSERHGRMHRSAIHRVWKVALKSAGLPLHHGVHTTRHSYAVELYRRTRDLRLTQRLLGHASPNTTQVYASLLDEDVRRGVEAIWAA
jgi:site-specific recombinase XerD